MTTVTPVIVAPDGFPVPAGAGERLAEATYEVQGYFTQQVGMTFAADYPLGFTLPQTWEEIRALHPGPAGGNIMKHAAAYLNTRFQLLDDTRTYRFVYFHPAPSITGLGGTRGMRYFGAASDWPRWSVAGDHKPHLMCGLSPTLLRASGWVFRDYDAHMGSVIGGYAHELIHAWIEHSHSYQLPAGSPVGGIALSYRQYPNVIIEPPAIDALRVSGYLA